MAQVVLGGIGSAIGGGLGEAVGAALGGAVDRAAIAGLSPARQRGPRLETLKVQSSADGAPMVWMTGRARVTGQVIWAARFLERRHEQGGGKGGPRTVDYAYSLSFAVGLCEGPIDGVGRIWADGRLMDLSGVSMRLYRGTADQTPDPLIEAVEGAAPAFRGTAYVVFEDLPLGAFGNRAPQLAFEVFRRARAETPGLEDRIEGVCLIPGAGEFVLATEPVARREGLTRVAAENSASGNGPVDFLTSVQQLLVQCPNLKRVNLVVGWFGDDLRAGHCRIRPGVERRDKPTEPLDWSVAGLDRAAAHLVSTTDSGPAYGGTPSDETVRQAIVALKARGLEVLVYPFVFMDIPTGNGLEDPYGGSEQAAYPWRGRVKGRHGAEAAADVTAVFGAADGWGLRRLALHYADMAVACGADGLLIASEMRGLTETRDADGGFPAVGALRSLAAECRAVVGPDAALSYAADWTEYSGVREGDDVVFHLDPLWADPAIDFVGIDWYPPMGDWRDGSGGVDAETFAGPDDPGYLAAQAAGGEGFDWFYADEAGRVGQVRTPIVDAAHGEHWVFRPKDLIGWWGHAHHDRPGGVRSATPTGWIPGMKPIRLTEFGCAAVDRGGNAPNRFLDPKSAESALPPFSTGARDDRMQRRLLEAVLDLMEGDANPVSPVYGGRMIAGMDAWCWDARPFPAFPVRDDLWADAGAWRAGHWLNGRMGGDAAAMIAAVIARAGMEVTVEPVAATLAGYVVDRPMAVGDALRPLVEGLGLAVVERGSGTAVLSTALETASLATAALALPGAGGAITATRSLELAPGAVRVRHIDEANRYQTGSVVVRSSGGGGGVDLDLPAVCDRALALTAARRVMATAQSERRLTVSLGPLEALALEPGDCIAVEGESGLWRLERLALEEAVAATLAPVVVVDAVEGDGPNDSRRDGPVVAAPFLRLLDLPPLPGEEQDARPLAAVALSPWRPMDIHAGVSVEALSRRGTALSPTTVGLLTAPIGPGLLHRWDEGASLVVSVEGLAPQTMNPTTVLAGGNLLALETAAGWELVQFREADLGEDGLWRLSGVLRGQQGTEVEMRAGAAAGAIVVFVDGATRVASAPGEQGASLIWRAGPSGAPPGGRSVANQVAVLSGKQKRRWSPAHLRASPAPGGWSVGWITRSPTADAWAPESPAQPAAARIRILDGEAVVRVVEGVTSPWIYTEESSEADFPDGFGPAARVAVSEWGEGFGWGVEAVRALAEG